MFFVTYDGVKALLKERRHADGQTNNYDQAGQPQATILNEATEHMLAASLGEIAACAVRVPTEVIKQRAQASQHPSSLAALQAILAQRSIGGSARVFQELYRGWTITILREVPFTMIQFPLWEALKTWRRTQKGSKSSTAGESAIAGCISGAIAAAATTPLDVLKTRMMLATSKQPLDKTARQIFTRSGPSAFFAGIGPRVAWISIGGAIFLGGYQWAYNGLRVGRLL